MSSATPDTRIRTVEELINAGPDVFSEIAWNVKERIEAQGRHAILRVTEIEIYALVLTVHFMGKGIAICAAESEARS